MPVTELSAVGAGAGVAPVDCDDMAGGDAVTPEPPVAIWPGTVAALGAPAPLPEVVAVPATVALLDGT